MVAMRNILDEFWFEKINLYSYCKKKSCETDELENYINRHKGQLSGTLTEEQKRTFEKYEDCFNELVEINELHIFKQGFKFGAQMTLCILDKED